MSRHSRPGEPDAVIGELPRHAAVDEDAEATAYIEADDLALAEDGFSWFTDPLVRPCVGGAR